MKFVRDPLSGLIVPGRARVRHLKRMHYWHAGYAPGIVTGKLPARPLVLTTIAKGAGTVGGQFTASGGNAAAFDSTIGIRTSGNTASRGVSASGYNNVLYKDWGAGNTKLLGQARFRSSSDERFGTIAGLGIRAVGSTDASTWQTLQQVAPADNLPGDYTLNALVLTTAYRYHGIMVEGNGANGANVGEIDWSEYL